jgi:hypothetical protein
VDLPVAWDNNYRIYLLLNASPGHELMRMVALYKSSDTILRVQHLDDLESDSPHYFELDFGMREYLVWNPDFAHPRGVETPTPFASPLTLEDPPGGYSYYDPGDDEEE